jgi:hypothetical protein
VAVGSRTSSSAFGPLRVSQGSTLHRGVRDLHVSLRVPRVSQGSTLHRGVRDRHVSLRDPRISRGTTPRRGVRSRHVSLRTPEGKPGQHQPAPRGPELPRVPSQGPCGQRSEAAMCPAGMSAAEDANLPRGTPPAVALNAIDLACSIAAATGLP